MDLIGADKLMKQVNEVTLPRIEKMVADLRGDIQLLLRKLEGASITLKLGDENEKRNPDLPVAPCHEPAGPGAEPT